jgi:hypothetical protein
MRHFSFSSYRLLPFRIAVFTCTGVVAVLLLILPIHAQARPDRPDSSARKELMESLRAYREKSVAPVMLTMKQRFDASLTTQELTTLNSLRSKQTVLQQALRDSLKAHKSSGRPARAGRGSRPEPPLFMREFRTAEIALMKELKPLAEQHKTMLQTIGSSMKTQQDQWKTDIEKIITDWRTKHDIQARDSSGHHRRGKHLRGMLGHKPFADGGAEADNARKGMMKKLKAAHFLLWDGKTHHPQSPTSSPFDNAVPQGIDDTPQGTGVFPNPAVQLANVRFTLREAGNITATLYDVTGKTIQTIVSNQSMNAGEHLLTVETDGLPAGTYLCRIQTPKGLLTRKVVVAK